MTAQQQKIIDSLVTEFNRINATPEVKAFNLINTKKLKSITESNSDWEKQAKLSMESWRETADCETYRIIGLLQKDLPDYVRVEKYNSDIGKYDLPKIQIRHKTTSPLSHFESLVTIEVVVKVHHDSNENGYSAEFSEGICYKVSPTAKRNDYSKGHRYNDCYDTIEDAVNDASFQDALRKRVIR